MIHERMVELDILLTLLLSDMEFDIADNGVKVLSSKWGDTYNLDQIATRANELLEEFLKPYVISSDSKE